VKTVEAAVIGVGWIGGLRADTLSRTALVDKLHLCDIKPDRLAEVKKLYKPATAVIDYKEIIGNLDHARSQSLSDRPRLPARRQACHAGKADRARIVGSRRTHSTIEAQ
jgi:myo-inositol 2-dehydrogenase/D-chiro-inositol 1-dehydrogenase